MTKHKKNHVATNDFQAQANNFINLTFKYCEQELLKNQFHQGLPNPPESQALAFAAISVEQSIKTFLAVSKIATND